jgi:hypothetical protein
MSFMNDVVAVRVLAQRVVEQVDVIEPASA